MIIPVKCFTCGKVLADKWNYFKEKSIEMDRKTDIENLTIEDLEVKSGHDKDNYFDTNKKAELLNKLGLTKICCRRHMLGHVDLIDII